MSLFLRKSIDELRADAFAEGEHSLKRELGPWNLISLGIGAIIGTGIFVLTGTAAALGDYDARFHPNPKPCRGGDL